MPGDKSPRVKTWVKKLLVAGSITEEDLEYFVGTLINTQTAIRKAPVHIRFFQRLLLFPLRNGRKQQRASISLILRIEIWNDGLLVV